MKCVAIHGTLCAVQQSRRTALATLAIALAACTGRPVSRLPDDALDAVLDGAVDASQADVFDAVIPACTATTLDWGGAAERMFPGSDCVGCHRDGGAAARHAYTVAGTIFTAVDCPAGLMGAIVRIDDAAGHHVELPANEVGNFFTDAVLIPPLHARVTLGAVSAEMSGGATTGSCNTCHTASDGGTGWISPNPR